MSCMNAYIDKAPNPFFLEGGGVKYLNIFDKISNLCYN